MSKRKKVTKKISNKLKDKNNKWNTLTFFIFLVFFALYIASSSQKNNIGQLSYSEFKDYVKQGAVSSVILKNQKVIGTFHNEITVGNKTTKTFTTFIPSIDDNSLMPLIENHRVNMKVEINEESWISTLLINLLPWLLIFGFFYYSSQQMKKRMGGAGDSSSPFSFYKSKAKLFEKNQDNKIDFNNIVGCDNAKKEMREIVEFLKDSSKFSKLGAVLPKGVLLVGPPGTGKTLMARAVAGEADVPFYSLSASEFIEMFVGVGASRVRDLFDEAKKSAPSIIFIDEIDSIGRSRGTGLGGGHDEREQTLNQILSEMDGFEKNTPVVVIAATNRPDVLDSALIRPGRFDRHVTMDLPQKDDRKEILQLHLKAMPISEDLDLDRISGATIGFSGAMLKNLVNEAAIFAARSNRDCVTMDDFESARDKLLMGVERNAKLEEKDKKIVAYHEAGHALAAHFLENSDPLTKITIIPRGMALGFTEQTPQEDKYNISKSYLLDKISILLAGRSAEEIVFNEVTTGAENDLKQATKIAKKMVSNWGMSKALGDVFYNNSEEHPFLGKEMALSKDFSDATAKEIDTCVREIISQQKQVIIKLLNEKRDVLDDLAQNLFEKESLNIKQIQEILGKYA